MSQDKVQIALGRVNCQELQKLKQFYPELNFDEEIEAQPDLGEYLRLSI